MTETGSTVEWLKKLAENDPYYANEEGWSAVVAVVEAAQEIATTQTEALKVIQQNGFVFEDIGKEPGNWQHLAFTLYTMLCEIDSKLSPLLDDLHSQASDEGKR